MDILVMIFSFFALLGILDLILGNRLKLGEEFEKGIQLVGTLTVAMLGMLCLVPLIGKLLSPIVTPMGEFLHLDPSIFFSMLLANDMGGAPLSAQLAISPEMGKFNGLVVSSMMGATVSFTIPVALKLIPERAKEDAMLGILCGIATIPVGCLAAGLIANIPLIPLLIDLIPLTIFAGIIVFGLKKAPGFSVKVITLFGKFITALILVGLGLGLFDFLTGVTLIEDLAPAEDSFALLFQLAFLLSGVFPFIKVLNLLLKKPLAILSSRIGLNEHSTLGLLTTLASATPTLGMTEEMDRKGVVLNTAFAVSAAFVLGDHLAFTVMFDETFALPVIIGKLVGGVAALAVALFVCKKNKI